MNELIDKLPKTWTTQPLSTFIAHLESGVSVNADDRMAVNTEIGVLKTSCAVNGRFIPKEHKAVWERDEKRARVNPRSGELIISRMNTPNLVGDTGFVRESEPNLFLPDRLWQTVRRADNNTDMRWLNHVLQWESIRKLVRDSATGTSNSMKNISKAAFLAIQVPTPPFQEQRGIAEVLCALDEHIEQTELLILKEQARVSGIQNDLLSCKRLDKSEVDDLPLREIVPSVQYGISSALESQGAVPVLRMNNLGGGEVDVSDLKYSPTDVPAELVLKDGDVLFNRTNSMEHVGRTSLWRGQLERATFASYLVRLTPDENRITKPYLAYLLSWEPNQIQMRRYATPAVQQVNINPTNLRRCRVRIPNSLKTQEEVVEVLDASREATVALKIELEKLHLQKQGLTRDLLTGKVRV
ncbi:hypothetical protein HFK84_15985 [Ralstonia pseudosolanacearum]|uniref:restriction endonuclease subunit S n=1 Tax=Ralstonia pseudosolanacearum TaxID=1310165 RepID=UPI00200549D6|nr:restriction endonuclease subunit S [Ralstonia pseudosolanacearum]MCK4143767.1 hypothetical protein [Ralstonia pseudosolanacearum]